MNAYEDLVFQAHCQIDYLNDAIDQGGRLESCDGDGVEVGLSDGSYMTVYLDPIRRLLDALSRLPKPETAT